MDGNEGKLKYVVTVLRGMEPIGIITVRALNESSEEVDVQCNPNAEHEEILEALRVAGHSVGYIVWKESGLLPHPIGYIAPDEPSPPPF